MHVRDGGFGVGRGGVEDVCNTAIGEELFVHGHFQVLDFAVAAEDLAEVSFIYVLGELFDNDLCAARDVWAAVSGMRARARSGVAAVAI